MTIRAIACVHAWRTDEDGNQTYADPETDPVEGWCVFVSYRDVSKPSEPLVDPEGAFQFDEDFPTREAAHEAAEVLRCRGKVDETREY